MGKALGDIIFNEPHGRLRALLVATCVFIATASSAQAPDPAETNEVAPSPRKKLLVTDLVASGVEPRVTKAVTQLIATDIARRDNFDVISGEDLRRMIELESEREALGCTNDASCLAEVAGALGAQRVVFGDITRLGSGFIVSLTLLDSTSATIVGRTSQQVEGEDRLAVMVPSLVAELLGDGGAAPKPTTAPTTPPKTAAPATADAGSGPPLLAIGTLGVGAASVVVGVVALAVGVAPLVAHTLAKSEAQTLEQQGGLGDVDRAKELYAVQEDANAQWQSFGAYTLGAGAGVTLVGIALAGAGATLLALDGGEDE